MTQIARIAALVLWIACTMACSTLQAAPKAADAPLASYEGKYDLGGRPLWLIAGDDRLAAVIGYAVYPLHRVQGDQFTNAVDQPVVFERDETGAITAVSDPNGRYPFLSPEIPPRMRALLRPRDPDAGPWAYSVPDADDPDIAAADAADAGLPHEALAELMRKLTGDPSFANVHSLLIYRRDALVFEEYFYGFSRNEPHDLRSATKSIHAALAGIALREGLLSLDTPIWAVLADHYRLQISPALRAVTVQDVLDMRTGLPCDDFNDDSPGNELRMMHADDWIKFLLALPPAPLAPAHYCSGAPIAVGRAIEILSGQSLPDYASQHLFEPLGIAKPGYSWDFDPTWKGDEHVASLFLTPRDMLRFGRLYLKGGAWNGVQILPANWVETTFHAAEPLGSWRRYSRFWWTFDIDETVDGAPRTFSVHAAMGNGGQRIVVAPDFDTVVVLTGGNYNTSDPTVRIIGMILKTMAENDEARRSR